MTGSAHGFPAPPQCLHKLGRLRGNREERGGLDEDVESASRQQFDQKQARSRQFLKLLLNRCNSAPPPTKSN
jgi:hypothetical protein